MSGEFSITNTTKSIQPQFRKNWSWVPFAKIKDAILGKDYCLSLVFIGQKKSKELNSKYRGKNRPTNVLSFPLDKKTGEIFITPKLAGKEVGFLFIHGLLHLKGMRHSSTMERLETKLRKQFGV